MNLSQPERRKQKIVVKESNVGGEVVPKSLFSLISGLQYKRVRISLFISACNNRIRIVGTEKISLLMNYTRSCASLVIF